MSTCFVTVENDGSRVPLRPGQDLLSALRDAGHKVNAPCGGNGTCGRCHVTLDGSDVLACRTSPDRDCVVHIPESGGMKVTTQGAVNITHGDAGLGVAVDIGTTTVAVYLYDLFNGRLLSSYGKRNAQYAFGSDVISRIRYASNSDGLMKLSGVIRGQMSGAIDELCEKTGHARSEVRLVSIAGNTVMEHILMLLSPEGIGVAPFEPLSLFGELISAAPVFSGLSPGAGLYLCPALAGYVGGDITAGLLSSGAWLDEEVCLFIDIGTNGEMGLGDRDGFLCCATAAGPAFEGAEIECGMEGRSGAISKVYYVNSSIVPDVIGGGKATGICGSGLIDALAVMLRCGAVSESGRLLPPDEAPEAVRDRILSGGNGQYRFYLTDEVYISSVDVRQIQLAKSAIRAGIETLLTASGKACDDLATAYIAGGFGAYMDVENACAIGLLPPSLRTKAVHVGNAAGAGAALALTARGREDLAALTGKCGYIELSESAVFMEKYIECMMFDEVEDVYGDQ